MDYRAVNQRGLENARFLLVDIGQAKQNERVTIICDDYTHPQATLLAICAKQLGLLPIVIDVSVYGTEYLTKVERPFLPHVKAALDASNLAFSFSPTYAWHLGGQKEFDAVHDGKRRFFTILGNGLDVWQFDKEVILAARRRTPVLRRLVSQGKTMRITTDLGTDLTCDIGLENFANVYDVLSLVPFYSEVAIVPKVTTCETWSLPYFPSTYWSTLPRPSSSKSISISGIEIRSGLRKRSNRRSYFIGSMWVIPRQYATTEPAAEPRPGPTGMP